MAISYDRLWKLLIDRKMNRTDLKEASGISFNVLARLGKNEPVSFETIEKICFSLNCNIEDVLEIHRDDSAKNLSRSYSTIELFAGAGGLALGVEKAGFDTLGLIEFDKDAADSLKLNRPSWRVIHDDIANISCLDLEKYFGIKKNSESDELRKQVEVLYYNSKDDFAIKLKTKQEDEVILCKNPKGNTFNEIYQNIAEHKNTYKERKLPCV